MELEKEILKLLEQDAKLSAKTIGVMLDKDEEKIKAVISKLEEDKIIWATILLLTGKDVGKKELLP